MKRTTLIAGKTPTLIREPQHPGVAHYLIHSYDYPARAAKLAGDQNRAKSYYEKLLAISRIADTSRPELVEAKAFLANISTSARR